MNKTVATPVFNTKPLRSNVVFNDNVLTIKNGVVKDGKYYDITVVSSSRIERVSSEQLEKIKQTYALLINTLGPRITPDRAAFYTTQIKTSYIVEDKAYEKTDQLARKELPHATTSWPSDEAIGEAGTDLQETYSIFQKHRMTLHDAIHEGILNSVTTEAPPNRVLGANVRDLHRRAPVTRNNVLGELADANKRFLVHLDHATHRDMPFSAFVEGKVGNRTNVDPDKFGKLLAALGSLRDQQGLSLTDDAEEMRKMCKDWYAEAFNYYLPKCGDDLVEAAVCARRGIALLKIDPEWIQGDNPL